MKNKSSTYYILGRVPLQPLDMILWDSQGLHYSLQIPEGFIHPFSPGLDLLEDLVSVLGSFPLVWGICYFVVPSHSPVLFGSPEHTDGRLTSA